jgi:predicted nucleotidyltransferase
MTVDPVRKATSLLAERGVAYALIGGHAVNVWAAPRFTRDVDVTVQASVPEMAALKEALLQAGLKVDREFGAELASGPDFVRFSAPDGVLILEIQNAKTDFQRQVVQRAREEDGVRVASPEDLIVLKLIANRSKDEVDLQNLTALGALDWSYIERWATSWGVRDRLDRLRRTTNS